MRDCMTTLAEKQALPFETKVKMTEQRIRDWYKHFNSDIIVADSGGKDSSVLLDLVRSIYPDVPGIFSNTGLEYPEIIQHVKTHKNIIWVRPDLSFKNVLTKYGYPVISKKVSMGVDRFNCTKDPQQKILRMYGGINPTSGKKQAVTIPQKYHYLVDAPFKISERCCYFLKKAPMKKIKSAVITGEMANESNLRKQNYIKYGCNMFDKNKSTPLAFWTESDIAEYIKTRNVKISSIYETETRTGCMFCMFGITEEQRKTGDNRFLRMAKSHPKYYNYAINKLEIGKVLDYIGIPY